MHFPTSTNGSILISVLHSRCFSVFGQTPSFVPSVFGIETQTAATETESSKILTGETNTTFRINNTNSPEGCSQ